MKDLYFKVKDGFIALKDYMGSDESIEQVARVSYGKGTRKTSDTAKLINYLVRHNHTSPLEHAVLQFHIKLPIHVWNQMGRHRTFRFAHINEYSMRYSEAIDTPELTDETQWRLQSTDNKQGSGEYLTDWPTGWTVKFNPDDGVVGRWEIYDENNQFFGAQVEHYSVTKPPTPGEFLSYHETTITLEAFSVYKKRLKLGVAKEQARKDLPLSVYTEAFFSVDLHNLFKFLELRLDSHAQLEIRQFAEIIAGITKEIFPLTFAAFQRYRLDGVYFTRDDKRLYDSITQVEDVVYIENTAEGLGLTKREGTEFYQKISKLHAPSKDYTLDKNLGYKHE